ncbi:non-ribosomal peptide synthetase [Streptoalloteichus hindustanus]|uniref:Amino acid adenylation domain-containing protein n=1 Tax=Streptoalloteichus hindustanus TaxID=2017 RepID=A0A1M5LYS9_STRHI|nr:non-ribosomal peptide synthetase [Streptoalloteichus hindustanus]SHG69553.1 amino acid adenylation domain-containing protein [Streptoalloteichus hindustanus]
MRERHPVGTLPDLLRARASRTPHAEAFTFLESRDGPELARPAPLAERTVDYATLDRLARGIAVRLRAAGSPGDRALLLYPPGPEYVAAFFGCLYAGVLAVPVYPPDPRRERSFGRLRAIAGNARARLVLTTTAVREGAAAVGEQAGLGESTWLATDDLDSTTTDLEDADDGAWTPPIAPDSPAFLQYTSGSTASPRGVVLTHANLMRNLAAIHDRFGLSEHSHGVIWLPPYHDMGLIGGLLGPIHGGFPVTLLSPLTFLRNPVTWLRALSERGGTCGGGPNFAYDLCVRKVSEEDRAGLDLSGWDLAFCGAEPVRAETLDAFAAAFAPCGFRREAFFPCYGLAEATLIVTGGPAGGGARVARFDRDALTRGQALPVDEEAPADSTTQRLVGCGGAVPGSRVLVVDPHTRMPLSPGRIGEIWVAGPSVAGGYWDDREATEETFGARLADPAAPERWLRTGDLGFLDDGELFVTGRHKDVLVVRGRNHHPHDIESTVERSHPALRPGCCAVFQAPDDGGVERVVVVQEVARRADDVRPAEVAAAVRRAVSARHGVAVDDVVLVATRTIPKTSSGKIQRRACRAAYLAGDLLRVDRDAPGPQGPEQVSPSGHAARNDLRRAPLGSRRALALSTVAALVAELGGVPVGEQNPEGGLVDNGLDSLAVTEFQHRAERQHAVTLSPSALIAATSLGAVADHILERIDQAPAAPTPKTETEIGPPDTKPLDTGPSNTAATRGPLPLSQGQRALWLLEQLNPRDPAYVIARAVRLHGPLDVAALRSVLRTLVARHEALRTTFTVVDGEPAQVVHDVVELPLDVEMVGGDVDAVDQWARDRATAPFDLAEGPLVRAALLAETPRQHVLVFAVHHIVADFWSLGLLLDEFRVLLSAASAGAEPAGLLPDPVPHRDYVRRQERYLTSPEAEEDWAYWRERLAGPVPRLRLPTERIDAPPPAPPTHGVALPRDLTARVHDFGRRHGITPFTVLLTAYQVLLHRWTGDHDIVVGTHVADRDWHGSARLVGYCVNTLPLRVDVADDPPFGALARRTGREVREALRHRRLPFPILVERLNPERHADSTPFFRTSFAFHGTRPGAPDALAALDMGVPETSVSVGPVRLTPFPVEPAGVRFDLTLTLSEVDGQLIGRWEYDPHLFAASTIRRIAECYAELLTAALANADRAVSRLSLLPPEQVDEALVRWNRTERAYDLDVTLPMLVQRQAHRTPDRTALVWRGHRLTYRELNRRANQVARLLCGRGVGPEDLVAIRLPRTPHLIITILGVLKSGAAYVPLDPDHPAHRVGVILREARPSLVITDDLDSVPGDVTAVRLPGLGELDALGDSDLHSTTRLHPRNLAYVLYTSGSTGTPKGVAIEHRSAVNLIHWAQETYTPDELAGTLAATSICFDLSIFEIFTPLTTGAMLILADNALDLADLGGVGVTLVNTVPSAIAELHAVQGIPRSVRAINLAGEPLPAALVRALYDRTSTRRVTNLYGPTEATTYVTYQDLPADCRDPVSIGVALPNTRTYLLDHHHQPTPTNTTTPLHLAGTPLARNYHHNPTHTATHFTPNPHTTTPGDRLYHTGDLTHRTTNGHLHYHGRTDHQTKLHGHRIEPTEIETTLHQHPHTHETTVVPHGEGRERRLLAYVTPAPPDGDQEELARALRNHLVERLPHYMIPAGFVFLDRLPRTPNGKVDRAALPPPEGAVLAAHQRHVAPRDRTEKRIAAVWASLLDQDRIGVHDDFFELGGNSLLAGRLVHELRREFGVRVPLRELFLDATVAHLAAAVEARRDPTGAPGDRRHPVPALDDLTDDEWDALLSGGAPDLPERASTAKEWDR